jgi:hypothetical protein
LRIDAMRNLSTRRTMCDGSEKQPYVINCKLFWFYGFSFLLEEITLAIPKLLSDSRSGSQTMK